MAPPSSLPVGVSARISRGLLISCWWRRAPLQTSQHVRTPPAAHTHQSDAETLCRPVEDEFFNLKLFTTRREFLTKASTYHLDFSLARPHSHKESLSPRQIIERLATGSPLELCSLTRVFSDYSITEQGGRYPPTHPR